MKLSARIKNSLVTALIDLCMMQGKPIISAKPTAVFCGMNMDHQAQELKLCIYSPVGGFTVTIAFTLLSSTTGGMLTTTRMIIS